MTRQLSHLQRAVLFCLLSAPGLASAALSDEIQVYTDDINAPHEFGLEMHVNTTPEGRKTPDYPGEAVPHHGLRVTPEFSYGITKTWEAGLYVPTNLDSSGEFDVAGAKVRLKWLPIRGEENAAGETIGWFLGANGELSRLQQKFSQSRTSAELRIMSGYHGEDWLVAFNPVFGWNLSDGLGSATPDLGIALKVARNVNEHVALGLEYYSELGTTKHINSLSEQDNTLYAAVDIATKAVNINFGVGRGLTSEADNWTVKAIFGFSF
jgi:hypothetical protein